MNEKVSELLGRQDTELYISKIFDLSNIVGQFNQHAKGVGIEISLYQFVLGVPDSQYHIRTLKELNDKFNILWKDQIKLVLPRIEE